MTLIGSHWRGATPLQRREGRAWYRNARRTILAMADASGVTKRCAGGVVAAMSPRTHWSRNLHVAGEILAGRTPSGVFRASLVKARAILAGAKPLCVLGGNKVRAFYRALVGDRTAVVIDVWILRALGLRSRAPTDRLYLRIAAAFTTVARRLRIAAADLQAVVWVTTRGRAE